MAKDNQRMIKGIHFNTISITLDSLKNAQKVMWLMFLHNFKNILSFKLVYLTFNADEDIVINISTQDSTSVWDIQYEQILCSDTAKLGMLINYIITIFNYYIITTITIFFTG